MRIRQSDNPLVIPYQPWAGYLRDCENIERIIKEVRRRAKKDRKKNKKRGKK